jgi:hypothetical protein
MSTNPKNEAEMKSKKEKKIEAAFAKYGHCLKCGLECNVHSQQCSICINYYNSDPQYYAKQTEIETSQQYDPDQGVSQIRVQSYLPGVSFRVKK